MAKDTPVTFKQGTLLFADIVGSTRLYEVLGDVAALQVVSGVIERLSGIVRQHGGQVVKTLGDEIMAVFPEPLPAVLAVMHMIEHGEPAGTLGHIPLRIGFHDGALLHAGENDLFGDTVNTASRLVKLCKPNQALASAEVIAGLPASLRSSFRLLGNFGLKGKEKDREVFELLQPRDESPTVLGTGSTVLLPPMCLHVGFAGNHYLIDSGHPVLQIGRAQDNDLVLDNALVSRRHARIELRRDKFVLVDESSNGTWVLFDGRDEIRLRREELVMLGSGVISAGCAPAHCAAAGLLRFSVH